MESRSSFRLPVCVGITLVATIMACAETESPVPQPTAPFVVQAGLVPESATMQIGDTLRVTLSTQAQSADRVDWTSDDTTVAQVSQQGVVVARSLGAALISAGMSGSVARMTVRVVAPPLPEVLFIAHRGYARIFPENTLTAFAGAMDRHADGIETDMQFTTDSVPIIMHDETVDRTTNGRGPIASMSFSQVRALDACSRFGKGFGPCQVPTVHEVLVLLRARHARGLLEIKGYWPDAMLRRVVQDIDTVGVRHLVTITSFEVDVLRRVRDIDRGISLGWYSYDLLDTRPLQKLRQVSAMFYDAAMIKDPARVESIHASLKETNDVLGAFTLQTTATARKLRGMNTGWFIADFPLPQDSVLAQPGG